MPLWFICMLQGFLSLGFQFLVAKHIAPYFGSSIVTWAFLISGTITAYLVGSFLGASRHITRVQASYWLVGAMLFYAATGSVMFQVLAQSLPFELGLGLATLLYVTLPVTGFSLLLPLLLRERQFSGAQVGQLLGFSGLGNLLGALGVTFALLPFVGLFTLRITWLVATVALALLWGQQFSAKRVLAAAWLPLLGCTGMDLLFQPSLSHQVYGQQSMYGWYAVTQDKAETRLYHYFNRSLSVQTAWDAAQSPLHQGVFQPLFAYWGKHAPATVLQIGLGGAGNNRAAAALPVPPTVVTLEINPEVVTIAHNYFQWAPTASDSLKVGDGRLLLGQEPAGRYDCIIIDAFFGDNAPEHLRSLEFHRLVASRLAPKGYVAINLPSYTKVFQWDLATLSSVYRHCYLLPCPAAPGEPTAISSKQVIFIGSHGPLDLPEVKIKPQPQHVLTDNYNPSPYLSL